MFLQELANAPVNLPAANDVIRIPFIKQSLHHFFDVIEIDFWLKRIVNAVVARFEQHLVIHSGVVSEMRTARCFH